MENWRGFFPEIFLGTNIPSLAFICDLVTLKKSHLLGVFHSLEPWKRDTDGDGYNAQWKKLAEGRMEILLSCVPVIANSKWPHRHWKLFVGGPCNPHVAVLHFPMSIPPWWHHRMCPYSMNENCVLRFPLGLSRSGFSLTDCVGAASRTEEWIFSVAAHQRQSFCFACYVFYFIKEGRLRWTKNNF